jgi:tripartite-type tricarboxylate transporter receptor subunit TctC
MHRPALRQMIERDGLELRGNSPAEARAFVGSENDKWTRIVKEKGLQIQ